MSVTMLKKIGMHKKLVWCFGLVTAGALAGSIYSTIMIRQMLGVMRVEVAGSAARLDHARQITIGLASMRSAMRGTSLFSLMHNAQQSATARSAFESNAGEMRKAIGELESLGLTQQERTAVETISQSLDQWVAGFKPFADESAQDPIGASNAALKTMTPMMNAIQKNAKEFGEQNAARERIAMERMDASIERFEELTIVAGLVVLLIGGGGLWTVAGMVRKLRQIAETMHTGAGQVAAAAGQVSGSSQTLAQGASESAASLEETSASTEEVRSMAHKSAENSQAAAEIVAENSRKFDETQHRLGEMVAAMGEITESSRKISKIIKVIDEIAFQTNILALNAAVEAARAGEAGMGFAVVADEVRNLAQRCSQAARDTAQLIEDSIEKSGGGQATVDRVTEAMRGIIEEAGRVKVLVDEISAGSREQAKGVDQIGRGVAQLESTGQTTASTAEESAAAAEELTAQAQTMASTSRELRELMEGSVA